MDVGAWLRGLGLGQYEQAFRDNEIDAAVLPRLTADDLKDMGVTVIGHRRRLLDAIDALHSDGGPPLPRGADANATPSPAAAPATQVERRQLTVMFVDLVGSTALSARLDPEDVREVISAYHRRVAADVERLGGFVAKYMGDGVLTYFGYPAAHEDDAERAVRAGLELVAAVGELASPAGAALRVRVGIATGLVVVGDLLGSGAAREEAVVGGTPNLAARLQALAEPDSVVIAAATRRLVADLFECADLGEVEAKGFAGPVRAYRVLGAGAIESRFEALHAGAALEPLIGREEELELLLRQWHQARGGEGRVVLLSGEPGIGKSRLLAALQERLAAERHVTLRYFCAPHCQDSAFHPIIAQLERAAAIGRDDPPPARLAKLGALLAQTSLPPDDIALLAELLSIPGGDRYPAPALTPQLRRERTFTALLDQLEGLARGRVVLVTFEDVHWIDPSSRELLDLLVERVARRPVLLLVTFRPEFRPPWVGQPHVTELSLSRLDRRVGATLVRRVAGDRTLPDDLVDEIVERTDGVPLFVEELTKAVLEAGAAGKAADHTAAGTAPAGMAVPATLHASLLARLDRLGPAAREVAQVGAAIGREFPYGLLAAVAQRGTAELDAALDRLVAAGLAFRRGAPPQATFLFKHALVRDAAYGTLLRGKRQELHRRIAQVLEEQWPETADTQPELLAQHCTRAGLVEQAVNYYLRAGQRALVRSSMAEAIAQLKKGLELVTSLPDAAPSWRQELGLQIALGRALIVTQGYAAAAVGETYARARALCERLDRPPEIMPVLYGQFAYYLVKGLLRPARALAAELLRRGEHSSDDAITGMGHRLSGVVGVHFGEFLTAREHLEQALVRFDPAHRLFYASFYVFDPLVALLYYLQWDLYCLGYPDQARSRSEAAVEEAQKLCHAYSLAHALTMACFVDWTARSRDELLARAETLVAVSDEHGFSYNRALGTIYRGWALTGSGQNTEGVALLRAGVAEYRRTGAVTYVPYLLTLLADAENKASQRDQGLGHLAEAERLMTEIDDRWIAAELYRVRGELLRAGHDPIPAERCYVQAIDIARQQSAKSWELRAAISLARLWRDRGKRIEARDLLAPVYGWFTEGFDTADLRDAKALLDELR